MKKYYLISLSVKICRAQNSHGQEIVLAVATNPISGNNTLTWFISVIRIGPTKPVLLVLFQEDSCFLLFIDVFFLLLLLIAGLLTGCFVSLFSLYAILAHLAGIFKPNSERLYVETVYPVFRCLLWTLSLIHLLILHINSTWFLTKKKKLEELNMP